MEFEQVAKLRRSIRQYREDKQITNEQLETILFAGMAAPISRKDYDSVKLIVVQNKALLDQLIKAWGKNSNPFYGAPTLIIVASKPSKVPNIDYLNVGGIIENMLLAATSLELGSIYLTAFLETLIGDDKLLSRLGIEKDYLPIAAIGVGYAKDGLKENSNEEIRGRIAVIRK